MDQMVIQKRSDAVTVTTNKFEHTFEQNRSNIASGSILLDVLKTLENEVRKRNLLATVHSYPFHPLWFQAENERNVFLWREGFSIIQKDDFEFWIDVNTLIEKRRQALRNSSYNHPLSNPQWPSMLDGAEAIALEESYLTELSELFIKLADQATALCAASSEVIRELRTHEPIKKMILLPTTRKTKRD